MEKLCGKLSVTIIDITKLEGDDQGRLNFWTLTMEVVQYNEHSSECSDN